jgi:hypothetical protein
LIKFPNTPTSIITAIMIAVDLLDSSTSIFFVRLCFSNL